MTVFNGCLKIIKSKVAIIIMYFVIFMGISIAMQLNADDTDVRNFQSHKVDIAFVDCDNSEISKYIYDYLNKNHNVQKMKYDKSLMQETLYYGQEDMVIRIPKGYGKTALKEDGKREVLMEITQQPGSYGYAYVKQQMDRLLNSMRKYVKAGFSTKQAYEKTISVKNSKITLIDVNGNGGQTPDFAYMFTFYPYLAIAIICSVIGMILVVLRRREIVRRMNSSATGLKSQNFQMILVFLIFGILVWLASLVTAFIMYGGVELFKAANIEIYIINSFVMTITAMAMAYFIGMILKKADTVTLIVTPLSLGMSFLCGVFVPLSMLGKTVKNIGKFFPVYWYEELNEILINYKVLDAEKMNHVYVNLGIQILFAAALIGGALVVSKNRQRE